MSGESSTKPLVVALCAVPLLKEVLVSALADIADVQTFPAHGGDTVGLLRWLKPDAVVVDADDEAEAAASFGHESNSPVLHISLQDRRLRLLRNGNWEEAGNGDTSSEDIRNIVAAGLFGRGTGHEHG